MSERVLISPKITFRLKPLDGENGAADCHLWRLVEGEIVVGQNILKFTGLATTVNLLLTILDPAGNIINKMHDFSPRDRYYRVTNEFIMDSIQALANKHWNS